MRRKNSSVQADILTTDIPYLLRHCAEQLFAHANITCCESLLDDLVPVPEYRTFFKEHAELRELTFTYRAGEDTLGLLYQSLCDIGNRKCSGSFYTPSHVAAKLISSHLPEISPSRTFFDPACGTGIFLLQLPPSVPLCNLYGNDLDPLSITLTRINLALKYGIQSEEELDILYRNFTVSDYLAESIEKRAAAASPIESNSDKAPIRYDVILGNPPWGAVLSEDKRKDYRKRFSCGSKKGTEIFDLFIEQSLLLLSERGTLSFVLPEALLNVKMHRPVRKLLLKTCTALSVEYLGDVFQNVYCPSVIFTLERKDGYAFYTNTKVTTKTGSYTIKTDRTSDDSAAFSFALSDEEYLLLEKIRHTPNCVTLKGNADFALGIVTGNNAALLMDTPANSAEPFIKGKDISKYHIDSSSGYLHFSPEHFQQTAPEKLYRAKEKLFYRFINRQLIFAYDNTGLLSLNSCNVVIPRIDGLSIKYVLAILNSSVAQFFFEKQFSSVKVLRSHLESIPIPVADAKTQEQIVAMVDVLMNTEKESQKYRTTFLTLDKLISELYTLNEKSYAALLASINWQAS